MALRELPTRPPPDLRRRLAHAAVDAGLSVGIYAQRMIRGWLAGPRVVPVEPSGTARFSELRISLADGEHAELRVLAARWDVSVNEAALRILDQVVPHEAGGQAARFGVP